MPPLPARARNWYRSSTSVSPTGPIIPPQGCPPEGRLGSPGCRMVRTVAYAVGETIEVCLALELPPARGIRHIVAVFANEYGEIIELTDAPARVSECMLQDPS